MNVWQWVRWLVLALVSLWLGLPASAGDAVRTDWVLPYPVELYLRPVITDDGGVVTITPEVYLAEDYGLANRKITLAEMWFELAGADLATLHALDADGWRLEAAGAYGGFGWTHALGEYPYPTTLRGRWLPLWSATAERTSGSVDFDWDANRILLEGNTSYWVNVPRPLRVWLWPAVYGPGEFFGPTGGPRSGPLGRLTDAQAGATAIVEVEHAYADAAPETVGYDLTVRLDVTDVGGGLWRIRPVLVAHKAGLIPEELQVGFFIVDGDPENDASAGAYLDDSAWWLGERIDSYYSAVVDYVQSDGIATSASALPVETDFEAWDIYVASAAAPVLDVNAHEYYSRVTGVDPSEGPYVQALSVRWLVP